jgi:hypothetical protein
MMVIMPWVCRSCVLLAVAGRFWAKGWSIPALLGRFRVWWRALAFGPFFLAHGISQRYN